MISTVLAEHHLLGRVLLTLAGLVAVLAAILLARRGSRGRPVAGLLTLVGLVAILALTLSPDPGAGPPFSRCNLAPYGFWHDLPNIVLFLLPGLFAALYLRRRWLALVLVPTLSAAVELAQFAIPAIGRRCDVDDWLANTVGGAAGVLLGIVLVRLLEPRLSPSDRGRSAS